MCSRFNKFTSHAGQITVYSTSYSCTACSKTVKNRGIALTSVVRQKALLAASI
jgi:deoxycytidylate deaminase